VVRGGAALGVLAAGLGVGVALAGSGGLDPSFGTGGTTVLERPTSTYPTPTALTPSGKIVVVSTSIGGGIVVSRRLPDGAPDPTFNGSGQAVIEEPGVPSASALAVQPDGKIILVGFRTEGEEEAATVWRLKADGGSGAPNDALDPTFANKGLAVIKTFTHTVGAAVAIQPNGMIDVAGRGFNTTGPNKVAVWRLTERGAPDLSFGTGGTAEISDGKEDSANAIALQSDGKIVLAGSTSLATSVNDAVVWRLKADGGGLDPTFDTDGQADVDSGGDETATGVALQSDGKIVIAGNTQGGPLGNDAMVWRLKANGGTENTTNDALDSTFGSAGAAPIGGTGVFARAAAVELQRDGKILVAGTTKVGTNPFVAVIWRLAASGGTGAVNSALDPTFGAGGAATVNAGSEASASALALQSDRRIIAAGSGLGQHLLLFRVLGDPFTLTVAKAGTGSGSVQSSPTAINCGAACSAQFDDGADVTLSASPAVGSAFAGWSGAGCSGPGSCALTMSADQTITATFAAQRPAPPPTAPMPTLGPPTLSGASQSNSIWREGNKLATFTKRHKLPLGTTFSFALNEQASLRFAFTQRLGGRKVNGKCVTQTKNNRRKPPCTRTVTLGTLNFTGHSGTNKVAFQGRISPSKKLKPGRYTLVITATNSALQHSTPKQLSFTIVK
jgi:uncharacterized delta-60 repeat protein